MERYIANVEMLDCFDGRLRTERVDFPTLEGVEENFRPGMEIRNGLDTVVAIVTRVEVEEETVL